MSDISISSPTMQTMAQNDFLDALQNMTEYQGRESGIILNNSAYSPEDKITISGQTVSPNFEDMGSGPDLSSTGTSYDVQSAVGSGVIESGLGAITDRVV